MTRLSWRGEEIPRLSLRDEVTLWFCTLLARIPGNWFGRRH